MPRFDILTRDGGARCGKLSLAHGEIDTPNFMPVATQGTVKALSPKVLVECGAQIILSNTYHLHLRPGDERIKQLGGLHRFIGWDGPILTDSGGYQVFSLAHLRSIDENGVRFRSHIDGSEIYLTPERVIEIQENLGVDIMMPLDECPPYPAEEAHVAKAVERTQRWLERSVEAKTTAQCLFSIIQGGSFTELRERSADHAAQLPLDGHAIGGVSVGESIEKIDEIVAHTAPLLPKDKPRYLMGVGTPRDLITAATQGIDLFDCVIPTRSARFGRIYLESSYINIRNSEYQDDPRPLEEGCDCYACLHFSRAYIAHLFRADEILGIELASTHNIRFYMRLMQDIRSAIHSGSLSGLLTKFSK